MKVIVSPGIAFLPCSYDWPTGLETSFEMLEGTTSGGVALSPSVILVCRGQGRPRQYLLAIWILFIRPRAFLFPRHGPWAYMKWAEVPRSFGPTISSKNKIIKILILKNNLLYFYPCFGLMSKILNPNSFLLIEIKL